MAEALNAERVRKVAVLARLKLSDAEVTDYVNKLGSVLQYVDTLNEIDTEGVEPMVHAIELSNVFRPDEIRESLPREAALANAPKTDKVFFLVPQILEDK